MRHGLTFKGVRDTPTLNKEPLLSNHLVASGERKIGALNFQTMDKKGIILYATQWAALQQMSDSELGGAIRELCGYAFNGVTPETPSVAFMFLKAQIDIDEQKYLEKCEKNRANISKRWNTEDTNVYDRIPTDTKRTNKDDKENKKENDKENIEEKNIQEKSEPSSAPIKFIFKKALIERGCNDQIASDYMAIRTRRKAPSTITAFQRIEREADKYIGAHPGATFEDVIRLMIEHNWLGFEAEWVRDSQPTADSEESEYIKAMNAQIRRQREIDAELEAERERRKREAANNNK